MQNAQSLYVALKDATEDATNAFSILTPEQVFIFTSGHVF